jgi:hypothetical protein
MSKWVKRRQDAWAESAPAQGTLPFDKVALAAYRVGLVFAPSWLFIDTAKRFRRETTSLKDHRALVEAHEKVTAKYASGWLVVLGLVWLLSPGDYLLAKAAACLALFRLTEIGNTILGFVLDRREPLLARSLVTVAFQALQIALIFAIVDHAFARGAFVARESGVADHVATTAFDYLYLSMTSMITVGNHYTPETGLARWLELGASAAGIVLLGVVVARAIGVSESRQA